MHTLTLRKLVPLMIVLAGLSVIASHYFTSLKFASDGVRQRATERVSTIGAHMGIMSAHLLQHNDGQTLQASLASLKTLPRLHEVIVTDSDAIITASTDDALVDLHIEDTRWKHLSEISDDWLEIGLSADQNSESLRVFETRTEEEIVGYVVPEGSAKRVDESASLTVGLVLVVADLTLDSQLMARQVRLFALASTLAVLLVACLYWYIINRVLSQPLSRLVDTSRELRAGNLQASAHLPDLNELGEISTALDSLAVRAIDGEKTQILNTRLNDIVEHSINEVFVAAATNFRILSANRVARERHGLVIDNDSMLFPWQFLPEVDASLLKKKLQSLHDGLRQKEVFETMLVGEDSHEYDAEITLQLLNSAAPPVILIIAKDIRQSKIQLKALKLRDRAIDAVDVGVSITDATQADHPLVYVNESLCTMSGYTRDELLGQPVRLMQQADPRQAAHEKIEQAQAVGEPVHVLLQSTRKDGSQFMDDLSLSPILSSNGQVTHYIGVNRDVTEALEKDRQFSRAQRLESVGLLTGGIAHDFNNLLSVVQGNLEFLSMKLVDKEQLDLLREAENATQMGTRLTRRLLAFARRSELAFDTVSVNSQVLDAVELLRSAVGASVTLSTSLAVDLWPVYCDSSQIENAIINLTLNARDAMPDGGSIRIESANMPVDEQDDDNPIGLPSGDYVRLSVADTGYGMSAEVQSRALEPFYTTKEQGKGTGLGLSTIYGFITQIGGEVRIDSEPNIGTTVSLYFPRHIASADSQLDVPQSQELLRLDDSYRVLVVEDNPAVAKVTVKRLNVLGYETCLASSAKQAIEILLGNTDIDQRIDMVFTDVVMEQTDSGFKLAGWIREHRPDCAIILTSAYSISRPIDTRDIPLLSKPYTLEELNVIIAKTRRSASVNS